MIRLDGKRVRRQANGALYEAMLSAIDGDMLTLPDDISDQFFEARPILFNSDTMEKAQAKHEALKNGSGRSDWQSSPSRYRAEVTPS
ncbi:MAG: hypothetical protein ACAH22_15170 [Tardiphaga sp.]